MRRLITLLLTLSLVTAGVVPVVGTVGATTPQTASDPASPDVSAMAGADAPTRPQTDGATGDNTTTVTVLSYNDIQTAAAEDGNLPRLVTLIERRRAAHDNPTVVVGAGDQIGPHALSPVSQWRAPVDVLTLVDPDADVVGNHEFDYGLDGVSGTTADSRFPWLATNLVNSSTGEPFDGTEEYEIVERDGVRVGIIGLVDYGATYGKTNIDFAAEGITLEAYTEDGPATAEYLKEEENVDVVVALAHTGVPDAKALAENDTADAIDVIAVGDDEIRYPPAETSGSIITESVARAEYLGELNLTVDTETNDVTAWNGRLVNVAEEVPKNETASRLINEYRAEVSLDENVTYSETALDARFSTNYHRESNYGNLVTDSFRAKTGADVAITNAGGIRSNRMYGPGNITGGDVFNTLPFPNTLVTVELTGSELRETLASQVVTLESDTGQEFGAEISQQVSGVRFEWVAHDDADPKIRDVWVNRAGPDEPPRWEPLQENETYEVTVNSFMAGGGSGYGLEDEPVVEETDVLYAEALVDYLESKERIAPTVEGRMRRVDSVVGAEAVELNGGLVTVSFDAPENATAINASSFYVQNATGATAPAVDATFDEADGTVDVTFDIVGVRPLVRPGGDLDVYGSYTDSQYEGEWVYWSSAVMNGDIDATDLSDLRGVGSASVLSASSTTVASGETGDVRLTLSTTEGFSGGDVTVSVDNGSVAEITSANYSDDLGLTEPPRVSENGTAVELTAADVERAIEPGAAEAHLATVSVRGVDTGTTDVTVTVGRFDNEAGNSSTLFVRDGRVVVGSASSSSSSNTTRGVNGSERVASDAVGLHQSVQSAA
ncbi:bifunctional metallophosphatase/5'-nucleotidase [Salinigranum rubrum]|uniref:Bifunctional metallophosphatase/5'-nucleotidase n=1 Tax=Salinigranum rubrum TaxID=755307 RepID=A0A2I8VF43_9EURY|nr:5'-nucleotidase C-terminal domain-containing protein [Salinigranum rubrum]AUV80547.1 bifunctional metallophosphatase/5'-nucleotidase [Salinigranum rubrum]